VVEHKRERLATWGKYSLFRQKDDFLHRYSESILTEDKLAAEEQQVANSICMLIFSDI
jgi:CelD/BcsL family acetyltransferase involved in cellulose biosynthesis